MASETETKTHFVLVHGSCHGAWCWYKLMPRLQSAGHRVTAVDLAASGINPSKIEDIVSLSDYSQPLLKLLDSLPAGDKVVLVGHSYAGFVFLCEQFKESISSDAGWLLDTEFSNHGTLDTLFSGPKFLSSRLYQLCPPEDVELAKALMRPSSYFVDDLSKASNFTQEGYGSVTRVFVTCNEDLVITMEFQQWMIKNVGVNEVLEIKNADHMAMLSKPQQLCDALLQLASKYT